MSLRTRMALMLVAMVLPVLTGFTLYRVAAEKRVMQERNAERMVSRVSHRGFKKCQRRPEKWDVKRRGMEFYSYGMDFKSMNPEAPRFPAVLQHRVNLDEPVHRRFWTGRRSGATAIQVGESGPCSIIVAYWENFPAPAPVYRSVAVQTFVLLILLVLTGLGIAGPLVARIRRLTEAVVQPDGYILDPKSNTNDELGELARAFGAAGERVARTIQELETRDEALKSYIANTTHDLAIPLTVLQHRLRKAQMLVENPEARGHLAIALEESHYIGSLVKNLNVSVKLQATDLYFQKHSQDLSDLVQRVITRHEVLAENKGVEFNSATPEVPIWVHCDSVLVEQAFSNIVQNAIQYASSGGHVAVVLDASEGRFVFQVIDDGPGIPETVLSRVHERAVRSDEARSRNPEGLGLGLSIATRVLALHDWALEFESLDGLTVTIRGEYTGERPEEES